jgi:hypothetical protein
MLRPQYDQVDEEDRQAHIGSRSDILSKSFVTDLWMKVIGRAVDDLVSISLMRQQGLPLKDEDKESEETAMSFLFDDNHRIAIDDYLVSVTCVSCQTIFSSPMSTFSCCESKCIRCDYLADPKICDYEITENQVYKDISLRELLATWDIDDIDGFRNGVRERIKSQVEKKNEASINRARLKYERKDKMANRVVEKVPSTGTVSCPNSTIYYPNDNMALGPKLKGDNFEVVSEEQLTEFDKGIIQVLDNVKSMLMAKNRKYGNSATNPVRAFSKADPREQIKVRIDDKISRLVRSTSQEEDEDVCDDLIGYLVILTALNKGYIKY